MKEFNEYSNEYVTNPLTNKLVLVRGRIGKELVRNIPLKRLKFVSFQEKREKRIKNGTCDYGMIMDKNKCVDISSKQGQEANVCHRSIVQNIMRKFKEETLFNS